ncbi:MAG: hypothetical protein ABFD05_08990 [Anaerolineaceae bacterium]
MLETLSPPVLGTSSGLCSPYMALRTPETGVNERIIDSFVSILFE